eukprot:3036000-Pleurochrysis_carterae.AAC.1
MAVGMFGQDYARSRGAQPWTSEEVRDEGKIAGKCGSKWPIKFADVQESVALVCKALCLV